MNLFYSVNCRLRQAAIKAGRTRRTDRQTVEEGTGAVFSVAQILRANHLHKPMLVSAQSDGAVRERVVHALKENDLTWVIWELPDRPVHAGDAEDLRMAWVRETCDSFVVLGDGPTIDFCKIAAALAAVKGRSFSSIAGHDRVRRRLPPVIAVPTSAGSGAEALAWAVLPDEAGQPAVVEDRELIPPYLVLDPELLEQTPRPALACASMDGLCLAVEAFLSRYADDSARALAADAVRGYLSALEPCWNSGGSTAQRSALMAASGLAGEAASAAGAGYARALCRQTAQSTGAETGELCAVLLPAVLAKYGNHASAGLAELAELCGLPAAGTKPETAEAFIERLRQLAFRIGLPEELPPLTDDSVYVIAERAASEANPRYACPVVWTAQDLIAVLRAAREHTIKT